MSIQDDIFDLEDALQDTPEYPQFVSIIKYLTRLENRNAKLTAVADGMLGALRVLSDIEKNGL